MAVDPKKLKEVNALLKEISKQYIKLGEKNPFEKFNTKNIKDVDKSIGILEKGLDKVEKKVLIMNTTFGDLQKTLTNIVRELDPKALKATTLLKKGMKGLVDEAQKLANEEEDIGSLSKKNLEKILERARASQKMAKDNAADVLQGIKLETAKGYTVNATSKSIDRRRKSYKDLSDEQKAAISIFHDENDIQKDLIKKIEDRIGLEDKFNKKIGFGGQLAKGLDKALQKAGLPALGIADAIDGARKNFIKTNGKSNVFKDTVKGIGKNLKGALSSANLIQGAFALLVKSIMEVDKASGEFAKNNGISYQRALKIRGEMNEIARSSKDVMVNSKELMKTQSTLNEFFGQSVVFGDKLAEDMTSIARRTKMTSETQGVFALESMKSGKGAKDLLKTQTLQVLEMNKQKGLHMSVKQVQDAIGKTSKALQLTFKGNTKELTKQVMSVKAIGANMQTANQIASSMLDFESSIQSELEAELLLGKDINIEKARQFALQGDMGKMSEEVLKNEAIMEAFNTKNVIAQEAAAKALGLNRDQLADMIMEQEKMEAIRATGAKDMNELQEKYNKDRAKGMSAEQAAANIKDKDLAAQLESVSAQEKMAATLERVQELFVALAEPILAIVTPIADILVPALTFVSEVLTGMVDIMTSIFDPTKSLSETFAEMGPMVSFIAAGLTAAGLAITLQMVPGMIKMAIATLSALPAMISTAIAAVTSASAMTLGIGAIAIAAGIAAVIVSMNSATSKAKQKAGDMLSPADGKTQVSTAEGGLFELSPNDDLVAAPGAADRMKNGGGRQDNSALIEEVKTLIGINRQILAKSPVIEMGGNEVGQGINTAEREIQ
jgi:hypothetical protein